jgi:hypothetical protein
MEESDQMTDKRRTPDYVAVAGLVAWLCIVAVYLTGCAVARPCEVGVCGDAQAHEPARKSGEDSTGTFDVTIPAACRNQFLDELFGECQEWGNQ